LEADLKGVEEISQERLVTVGNLRNELLTAQDQLNALDAQMAKDREKLLKLREDKKILLDKVLFLFRKLLAARQTDRFGDRRSRIQGLSADHSATSHDKARDLQRVHECIV